MADQVYGFSSIYGSSAAPSKVGMTAAAAAAAAAASSRYHQMGSPSPDPAPYSSFPSSIYFPKSKKDDSFTYSAADVGAASYYSSEYDPIASSIKRSSQALYQPSIYGAQSTSVQSEAWFTADSLSKRARFESASNLPIYPQRPGEKDCAHYMLTRTCKFGYSCKFDHPIWVPEGGIPDWKEVPLVATPEALPERLGEPDCPYFVKTQRCKFGLRCRFNHPKSITAPGTSENTVGSGLPQRPSEHPCAFYMKTGICKFGATCKFHHPLDIIALKSDQYNGGGEQSESLNKIGAIGDANLITPFGSISPAPLHNSKGLPIRPGEAGCPFYMKTGSCKYGATCRYNHPDYAINPAVVAAIAANPLASLYQASNPSFVAMTLGVSPTMYPQRPGQSECDYYMKTGECKFGESCKYHHPLDRSAQTTTAPNQPEQGLKLTLAGLPRREGSISCPYYMKTGVCKYGVTCKFDHPPPGEVAMAASQVPGDAATPAEEAKEGDKI